MQLPKADCGTGTYDWVAGSVTYNDCNGLLGTIEWTDTSYTVDIVYDFATAQIAGYAGTYSFSGSVSISDTMIDGGLDFALEFNYDMGGQVVDYASTYAVTYNAIALSADGCPEGGSMDIKGKYKVVSAGQTFNQSINITAEFNACDDVTLFY
ncbi:MAG: hypothetical protein GY869_09320 [Planctomycetes bacterium]|nr:hypothetical protein [Planctomycetota bacterium]